MRTVRPRAVDRVTLALRPRSATSRRTRARTVGLVASGRSSFPPQLPLNQVFALTGTPEVNVPSAPVTMGAIAVNGPFPAAASSVSAPARGGSIRPVNTTSSPWGTTVPDARMTIRGARSGMTVQRAIGASGLPARSVREPIDTTYGEPSWRSTAAVNVPVRDTGSYAYVPWMIVPAESWRISPKSAHVELWIDSENRTERMGRTPRAVPPGCGSRQTTVGGIVSRAMVACAGTERVPAPSMTRTHSSFGPSGGSNDQRTVGAYAVQSRHVAASALNCIARTPERSSVATTVTVTARSFVAGAPPLSESATWGGVVSAEIRTASRYDPTTFVKPLRSR